VGFVERYGPWACVAGASKGIGLALADEAAGRGLDVVMVARREEPLRRAAAEVAARHGVQTLAIPADLAAAEDVGRIAQATDALDVGLLVHNAAGAPVGRFLDVPLARQLRSVAVNCAATVGLCHVFGSRLVARGAGGIALVNSNGGVQGSINYGTYNAGKAFEWILAETLWAELGDQGVDVMTMFVGPTSSPSYLAYQATLDPELCGRADSDDLLDRLRARLLSPSTPEEVARRLFDQLGDGPVCFTCAEDEWIHRTSLSLPRREAVRAWVGLQQTSQPDAETLARWSRRS
jgi:short-subunit dehydrogenase